ncbi:PAS domain-containing sensor histidine kinase [Methanogenium organophilum]|uniref:histidine kinase n=1 Tax=Methanogenium organophilum TaxID=2199 RepID=A0A9X9S6X8_METOG|nr:PAS domain-containing sensor histidine kinase [Methanogenium organophilum]WAI02518.1 PAS domain-containing sensor histidine kinase [Methanogenium organophilum]
MGDPVPDYRAAFLNNAVPMCIIDENGYLCSVNRAATDYFRNTPPDPDEISRLFSSGVGGRSISDGNGPVLDAADAVPVSWHGEGAHLLAAVDVTRHANESARLRSVLDHILVAEEGAGIGFWDTYLQENTLSVDSGWAHLIGYEVEELGKSVDEIFINRIHPKDRAGVQAFIGRLEKGATPSARAEFRMRHRDGRWIWVRSVCRVVADDGRGVPTRVAGIHMDITQEHEVLEALTEAKKKIQLLSSVTRHDILNQVSIILMCDELVRGDIGAASLPPEKADHYWDMMNAAAHTIERVISFTRDYDSLGMEPPRWQSLATVVRNAEILLHGTGVPVTLSCGDMEVFADPLFEKVIYNLLENVGRHADEAEHIWIDCEEYEEGCVLMLSDDGKGVPVEMKERIFERGYGSNTGLGLFLCREMLGITGITITECGTPGEGAVFRMVFPRHHIRGSVDPL